jgi:hypothetical protein
MLKSYTFWLSAAVLFMFLTAILHSLSFFVTPDIQNETQRQLHELLHNYREDMGVGFHRTFWDLFTALSACLPLMCMLGGLTLGYMLIKHAEANLIRWPHRDQSRCVRCVSRRSIRVCVYSTGGADRIDRAKSAPRVHLLPKRGLAHERHEKHESWPIAIPEYTIFRASLFVPFVCFVGNS